MEKKQTNYQPWERSFSQIATPFGEFIHNASASGLVLMACTIAALLLANGFLADHYNHILHMEIAISIGEWELEHTLHHWINDALMALFFMLVGLEIKREFIIGELSQPSAAMMPIIAAFGGMVVPALLYYAFNPTGDGVHGWGVPMATDIAFAVGVMVLLGTRIPKSVLTFLLALAIVDDLGAVIVIALFYTDNLQIGWLIAAGLVFATLGAFNLMGIRKPLPYFIVGMVLWLALLQSGVHATLAGVLTALTIPVKPKFDTGLFVEHMQEVLTSLRQSYEGTVSKQGKDTYFIVQNHNSRALLQTMENGIHEVESPLQRLEHSLHIPVAFMIVPLFALANAGIPINVDELGRTLGHPVTLGVMAGLIFGKLIGVAGITWLAIKLGFGTLPTGMTHRHLVGVGLVAGIGFTMSIFIAELAFTVQAEELLMAKTGVMFASLIAGVAGYLWLRFVPEKL